MNVAAKTGSRKKVLIYSGDPDLQRRLDVIFASLADYEAVTMEPSAFLAAKGAKLDDVDIVVVDAGDGALLQDDQLAAARARIGHLPLIFVSDALAPERMRLLMRLDIADWVPKPLEGRAFIDALNSVTKKLNAAKNMVHAVVPVGGGAGATTLAIMLAHSLSRPKKREKPSVALLDLDFTEGYCGAYLNIDNAYDLAGVAERPERIDMEFVNVIRKTHGSGFNLFSFESETLLRAQKAEELVLRMLDVIAFQHDHTVLDMSSASMVWDEAVLRTVNSVTVVCNQNVPSLQRGRDIVRKLKRIRGDVRDVAVVINRVKLGLFKAPIGKKELEKIFGAVPVTFLPDEHNTMVEALNRGVLPVEAHPRSAYCSRVAKLSDTMLVPAKV